MLFHFILQLKLSSYLKHRPALVLHIAIPNHHSAQQRQVYMLLAWKQDWKQGKKIFHKALSQLYTTTNTSAKEWEEQGLKFPLYGIPKRIAQSTVCTVTELEKTFISSNLLNQLSFLFIYPKLHDAKVTVITAQNEHYYDTVLTDNWLVKGYPPHNTRINEGHNNVTKQPAWTTVLLRERDIKLHMKFGATSSC